MPSADMLVLPSVGAGFLTAPNTDAAMDLDTAAKATVTPQSETGTQLARAGYASGWSHVWTDSASDQVAILAFVFTQGGKPTMFTAYVRSYLGSLSSAFAVSDGVIPEAFDYVLNGTVLGGTSVFCQGVFFALSSAAVEVRTCEHAPSGEAQVEQLAATEYRWAAQQFGVAAPTIVGSPPPPTAQSSSTE